MDVGVRVVRGGVAVAVMAVRRLVVKGVLRELARVCVEVHADVDSF